MTSTSALTLIQRLNEDLPLPEKKGGGLDEILNFLNQELSFAGFSVARANSNGELPKDQYFASNHFPIFNPRKLDEAIQNKKSIVEDLNQILIVPCLYMDQLVGVLFAHPKTGAWNSAQSILVELAATELARILSPQNPGLTLGSALKKSKSKALRNHPPAMIGVSERLKHIQSIISKVAPTSASVLVLGESGTGKEVIAKQIHFQSDRKDHEFVAINCGAITETLLESELFGHEKGSFTGASTAKKGLVEIANGGTLFLDEIGEMALSLQAKLLRFLQEGEFYRVGGKEPIHVNARIISATNRDLEAEARTGKFREDLYYRLNTISIKSPPLRERKDDIPLLIEHFAPGTVKILSKEAMTTLQNYSWPGNIRELQNAIERMRILSSEGRIELSDLPQSIRNLNQGKKGTLLNGAPPVSMSLEELERIHILRCLDHFEGNKTRAAQSLGITIKTLYNKLHRYGILEKSEANH